MTSVRRQTVRTQIAMDTMVTVHVLRAGPDVDDAIARALGWFHEVEQRCTRFSAASELMQLTAQPGIAIPSSAILFEAVQFAVTLAAETAGAFDPTVGHRMAARGVNREHRTGEVVPPLPAADDISYRDVHLDPQHRTITLLRPLTLDLGAVAKGLAVDAAARELAPFEDFAIDFGGDLYLGGLNPQGEPWRVGIRHPREDDAVIDALLVSNQAVCTSGDYERGPHILDPRTNSSSSSVASATVVAPNAMLADALATAAFVLGPTEGLALLDKLGVSGLIVTPDLQRHETGNLLHA